MARLRCAFGYAAVIISAVISLSAIVAMTVKSVMWGRAPEAGQWLIAVATAFIALLADYYWQEECDC